MNNEYKKTIMSSFRVKQLLEISATTMMQNRNNVQSQDMPIPYIETFSFSMGANND